MVRIRGIKLPLHLFVARVMKTIAYLRVSTDSQDLANQKLAVLDYARQKRFAIDHFVEAQASSRKGRDQRRIEELLGSLTVGDRPVVSELSRLGRSLGQVIQLVDELVKRKVRFTAIKEGIRFEGKQDLQTKVMIALFGLFAEVERDLISERTKEGLAAARAKGLRAVDGLGMLLHQAVRGFSLWFGVYPKVTPELRSLVEADLARC